MEEYDLERELFAVIKEMEKIQNVRVLYFVSSKERMKEVLEALKRVRQITRKSIEIYEGIAFYFGGSITPLFYDKEEKEIINITGKKEEMCGPKDKIFSHPDKEINGLGVSLLHKVIQRYLESTDNQRA